MNYPPPGKSTLKITLSAVRTPAWEIKDGLESRNFCDLLALDIRHRILIRS